MLPPFRRAGQSIFACVCHFWKVTIKLIQGFPQTFPVVLFKTPDWAIHTIENPKLQISLVYVNGPSIVVRSRKLENVSTNFSSHLTWALPIVKGVIKVKGVSPEWR